MRTLLFIIGIFLLVGKSFAGLYYIDGDLIKDWGVKPGLYGSSDWKPNEGVFWISEDQTGGDDAYVGPGWGGQLYDVEAIYFDYDNEYAYIAIVTGFPYSGDYWNNYRFLPGDIAIDFEIDGKYEYGIITTSSYYRPYYAVLGSPGDVYRVTSWAVAYERTRYEGTWKGESDPTVIKKGEKIGHVELCYKKKYYAGDYKWHYVIETKVPLDIFGDDWGLPLRVHWTQTCGNDYLNLDVIIPEPSSIFLLSLGLFGLGSFFRKKYS